MTEASELRPFMERTFGDFAAEISAAFVAGGLSSHRRAQAAQDASELRSNQPYGSTYWLALHEEVVGRLLAILPGSLVFPPKGAQFQLVVWEGRIILPVKLIDGGNRDGRLRIRTSRLRSNLTSVNMPEAPTPTLFDDESDTLAVFEEAMLEIIIKAMASIDNIASTVILAAYGCTPKAGLQIIEVGIATLDEDGYVDFTDSERLSLIAPPAEGRNLTEAAGDTWTNSPKPKPFLEVVRDDDEATGTADADTDDDAPGPE